MRSPNAKLVLALVLSVIVSIPLSRAAAAPFTPYFADLLTLLNNRAALLTGKLTAQQKKEKSAYTTVIKAINKKSTSLTTDLKTLQAITNKLDTVFPADTEISGLEDTLITQLTAEVQEESDALEVTLLNMVPGTKKTDAQSMLLTANAYIVSSQQQPTHFKRAKDLNNALAAIIKSQKVTKVSPKIVTEGVACLVNGFNFASNSSSFTLSSSQFTITATQAAGPPSVIHIVYPTQGIFVAGATYTLAPGTGTYTNNDTTEVFVIDGGSIHINDLDKSKNSVSGVFSFLATGPTSGSLSVSQGFFISKNLILQ